MKAIERRQRRALWFLAGAAVVLLSLLVGLAVQGLRQQAIDSKRAEFSNLARVFDEHVSRIVKLNDQWIVSLRAAYESDPGEFFAPAVAVRDRRCHRYCAANRHYR
jgi:CHASE1-domain containing sensor protein